jgi:hypothetical protein
MPRVSRPSSGPGTWASAGGSELIVRRLWPTAWPGLVVLAVAGAFACGCQAIFGDFSVGSPPAEEPAPVLGVACEPGAYRCAGANLETCSDDRSGWIVAEVCNSDAECNLNARTCRACVPGERMCRGEFLEQCDDAFTWQPDTTCATAALCSVTSDLLSGSCALPACDEAGAHVCDGAKLMRCSAGQERLEAVALCATRELCDPGYANDLAASGERGACRSPVCAPDSYRCDGDTLRHCAFDRADWQEATIVCESSDLCSARRGTCAACEPGEAECNGAELRRCSSDGTWETLETCASAALCDEATGICFDADCDEPGALRCGRGGIPVLEVCSVDLIWERAEVCASVELCSESAGRCLTPACGEGETTRCLGNRHESCSSDRTRWEVTTTCGEAEHCDPTEGCLPGPCTEQTVRCNGPSLERCVLGRFEQEQRCATFALCNAETASCTPPVCEAGSFDCRNNAIIRRCLPGRDDYEEIRTCQGASTCDPAPLPGTGQPECVACGANAYTCDGMDLLRCSPDGVEDEKVSSCPTSCSVVDGEPVCP